MLRQIFDYGLVKDSHRVRLVCHLAASRSLARTSTSNDLMDHGIFCRADLGGSWLFMYYNVHTHITQVLRIVDSALITAEVLLSTNQPDHLLCTISCGSTETTAVVFYGTN